MASIKSKQILVALLLLQVLSFTVIPVLAVDDGSSWTETSPKIEWIYRDVGDESYFRITNSGDNGEWTYDIETWTYDYVDSSSFEFKLWQADEFLTMQSGEIKVRAPGGSWQIIASDAYGSDPARCEATKTKTWLYQYRSEHVEGNWYRTEVYFKGTFTFFGTTTYESQFYILFQYSTS